MGGGGGKGGGGKGGRGDKSIVGAIVEVRPPLLGFALDPRCPNPALALLAIVQVRAGTGGDEAALFSGEIFEMYQKYSKVCGCPE